MSRFAKVAENVPLTSVVAIGSRKPYISPENVPLDETTLLGGGGGGGPVEPSVSMKDYVDARGDAVESRLASKLDKLPTQGTIWGAVATAVAIILASLAFASDRFNGGLSVSPLVAAAQSQQAAIDKKQDAQMAVMDAKLDILIKQTAKP